MLFRSYGFDDAIYTAAMLSKIITSSDITIEEMINEFPKTYSTPELNLNVEDHAKFEMIKTFISKMNFADAEINLIDGIRVTKSNSWGLLRASNTSPKFVLRFEGNTPQDMESIKNEFEKNLNQIFPDLSLEYC